MTEQRSNPNPLAVRCRYLQRPFVVRGGEPSTVCNHPVREGQACVGPFLHDLATACGLWEAHPESNLIASPQPERWQGRRRRDGFDMRRGWR